jgi:hypothetical protein
VTLDHRASPPRIFDLPDTPEPHWCASGDGAHTAQAIVSSSSLAHLCEHAQDSPFGPYLHEMPRTRTDPAPPEPAATEAVTVTQLAS